MLPEVEVRDIDLGESVYQCPEGVLPLLTKPNVNCITFALLVVNPHTCITVEATFCLISNMTDAISRNWWTAEIGYHHILALLPVGISLSKKERVIHGIIVAPIVSPK